MARFGRLAGWTKLFLKLALADIRSVPHRLRARINGAIATAMIFFPSCLLLKISSRIKAYRRGVSLEEFWRQEAEEARLERLVLEWALRRRKIQLMNDLVKAMPGATVNDFDELLGNHFLSLRFLRNSLWELILGRG